MLNRFTLLAILLTVSVAVHSGGDPVFAGQQQGTKQPRRPSTVRRIRQRRAPPPKWSPSLLDVFFSDARQGLGTRKRPEVSIEPLAIDPPVESPGKMPPGAPSPGSEATKWSDLVSPSALEDEVKYQSRQTTGNLRNSVLFGREHRTVGRHFGTLAVLFAVIDRYGAEVRWQDQAAALSTVCSQTNRNCQTSSAAAYKSAKQRSDEIQDLIRGNPPVFDVAEVTLGWSELTDRPSLMSRMELSQEDRLSVWTSSEDAFKKNREGLANEAQILAMLAEVIEDPGFEYAEEALYREHLSALQQGCQDLLVAARDNQSEAAQRAVSAIGMACDRCHGDFR